MVSSADAVLHERCETMKLKKYVSIEKVKRMVFLISIGVLCLAFCACDSEQGRTELIPTLQPSPTAVELSPTVPATPSEMPVSGSTPTPTQAQNNVYTPTPNMTPTPTENPFPTDSLSPSATPTTNPTPSPTATPTPSPTATPIPSPTATPPEPYFENPLVETAVRKELGNPDRALVPEDLATITVLNLSECELTDVSFLSEFTNLQELDLSWNNLSDSTSLPKLKHLTKLDLSYNFISEIQVLSSYTELTELSLRANNLERLTKPEEQQEKNETEEPTAPADASVFAGFGRLRRLDLSYNILTDVSELAGLTTLEYLNLEKNRITDFSAVEFVPELIR